MNKLIEILNILNRWIMKTKSVIQAIFKPRNVIKIKTLSRFNDLDLDDIYLHSCFSIFVRFIEEEADLVGPKTASKQVRIQYLISHLHKGTRHEQKLAQLYEWWVSYSAKGRNIYPKAFLVDASYMVNDSFDVWFSNELTIEEELSALVVNHINTKNKHAEETNLATLTSIRSQLWH